MIQLRLKVREGLLRSLTSFPQEYPTQYLAWTLKFGKLSTNVLLNE